MNKLFIALCINTIGMIITGVIGFNNIAHMRGGVLYKFNVMLCSCFLMGLAGNMVLNSFAPFRKLNFWANQIIYFVIGVLIWVLTII